MRGIAPLVHARAVGLVVETADQRREAADERREDEHEPGGDDEAHQGVAVTGQRPE